MQMPNSLSNLAGAAAGGGSLTDMAGGAPPTQSQPGGSPPMFDKAMYGYDTVAQAMEQLSQLERSLGDDVASAKLKSMAATINSMRASKLEKLKKLQSNMQGAMMGVS